MKWVVLKRRQVGMAAFLFFFCGILSLGVWQQSRTIQVQSFDEPIYQGNTGKKLAAITVNVDWGEEYIPAMLESFKKYDVRVTFFVTGKWAQQHPELLKKMSAAGHSIQNHGYRHCHFNRLNKEEIQAEIRQADKIISAITGSSTKYFAPPYGEFDDHLVKAVSDMNYGFIMWSVDTVDWKRPSPQTIHDRVLKRIHNDAIILMHPTEPTVKALPGILQSLQADGYGLVKIEDLIVNKGESAHEEA
ncbi:MAG TPA: polysaccharide deacetylase family protein [Syntrophomonadaceae bacterium]|nr:polysaccharide deacetylase family protein [Syntrophomonadaceae bacterium]